jgi:hypothetical protein
LKTTAKADGSDIVFTAGDMVTKLNHELEQYNSGTGQVVAWVNVPAVSPVTDTVLYVYYGNPSAANQQNAAGVWDANYKGVWHLKEATGAAVSDSTSNANVGTPAGPPAQTTGSVGSGLSFNKTSGTYVDLGSTISLDTGSAYTISAWVNLTNYTNDAYPPVLGFKTNSAHAEAVGFSLSNQTGYKDVLLGSATDWARVRADVGGIAGGSGFHHVTITYNGAGAGNAGNFGIYFDGTSRTTAASGSYVGGTAANRIGKSPDGHYFTGAIDEVRVSSGVARTADWILTEYRNQNASGSFLTVGTQENLTGGASH